MKKNEIREQEVLRHLIEEHLISHDTVASGTLRDKYVTHVSPATLRIDLHKLEEKGFIYQPHTSSGRLPTVKGYRKYLDLIQPTLHRSQYERGSLIRELLSKYHDDITQMLHYIMKLIARETDQLSFVAEPELSWGMLSKLDAFKIAPRKLLFVVSLYSGLDKTMIVNCDYEISEQQLRALVRYTNDELVGKRIHDIQHRYLREFPDELEGGNKLLGLFLREFKLALGEMTRYYVDFDAGISFLNQPEFDEKERILVFFEMMQRQAVLVNLMQKNIGDSPWCALMGEELEHPEWNDYVLVFARYKLFEVPGFLGVLSPLRMDYRKNIPVIRDIARMITHLTKKGIVLRRDENEIDGHARFSGETSG